MGGQQAAQTLLTVHQDNPKNPALTPEQQTAFLQPILDKYEHEGNPYYATARLWDDGVIDPRQTRNVLAQALAATSGAPLAPVANGIFRM